MCDIYEKNFILCMKQPIKNEKCKKEFDAWDTCYKSLYLSEFKNINSHTTDKERIEYSPSDIIYRMIII